MKQRTSKARRHTLVREEQQDGQGCRSSVVERVLGKDEAESSILSDSTITRFWSKVDVRIVSPDGNPCWNWTGSTDRHGYGQFKLKSRCSPKRSHRVAWQIACGDIPAGKHVIHDCDNPKCCNPLHLRIGTHARNMADKKTRNRAWKGGPTKKVAA